MFQNHPEILCFAYVYFPEPKIYRIKCSVGIIIAHTFALSVRLESGYNNSNKIIPKAYISRLNETGSLVGGV